MKRILPALTGGAITLVALGAAFAVPAADAGSTSCPVVTTTTIFSPFGDSALYKPFQGSSFESGASGWSWGNKANIVSGDDGALPAAPGSHAVNIPASGTAKSPWLCVDSTMPSMRFMVRRVSGTGSLTVTGVLNTSSGKQVTTVATVYPGTSWTASPVIVFPPTLATAVSVGSINAQFQFVADAGSSFRIDDVYMDPYKVI
jgi:hypothetical protein